MTVNGVALPHINQGLYSGELHEAAPDRSPLKVEVKVGDITVEATGTVFEAPVITSPAEGSVFSATDLVEVTWVRTADPARFYVCINCWENSLDGAVYSLPGTARQTTIPARDLADYGTGTIIVISAGERGSLSFTGPVTSDSYIESSSSSTLRVLRP